MAVMACWLLIYEGETPHINIRIQFLSSIYAPPQDIDLFELLYCGTGTEESPYLVFWIRGDGSRVPLEAYIAGDVLCYMFYSNPYTFLNELEDGKDIQQTTLQRFWRPIRSLLRRFAASMTWGTDWSI